MHTLETQIFVAGDPGLLERGRERLRALRLCRPPGLAVDEVVDDLLDEGASGVLVQLGGVVRAAGRSPTDDGWLTVVPHPRGHFATAVLRLQDAAVATVALPANGQTRRGDDLVGVSVVAGQAWEAELLATTALAGGAATARVPALLLDDWDEATHLNGWTALSAAGHPGLLASSA
jgi:hypothetical protein